MAPTGFKGPEEMLATRTTPVLCFPHFHALVVQLSPWYYCNIFEGQCIFSDLVLKNIYSGLQKIFFLNDPFKIL